MYLKEKRTFSLEKKSTLYCVLGKFKTYPNDIYAMV